MKKNGTPVYATNPSIPNKSEITKARRTQVGDDRQGMVIDPGTGEILGRGGAYVYEFEEVDKDRFVKMYLDGVKQATGLTKAGLAMFEIVYNQMQDNPGEDKVHLSYMTADIGKSTYYRGVKELLEKEFVYKSPYDGVFFVNIRYMFNGDRLAFVKGYHLKGATTQGEFALEDQG